MTDDRRPHFLFQHRPIARRRGRDPPAQRRRRYRLVHLAPRVLAHRAGAARRPLCGERARGLSPVRHPAHALCGRGYDRRRALGAFIARAYKDALVSPEEIDTGALILTGVAVAPAQCAGDRRTFRARGRQARGGECRRQSRDHHGGARLRRGRALDPRRHRGDERRRGRRHVKDRGLRRWPGRGRRPRSMSARGSSASIRTAPFGASSQPDNALAPNSGSRSSPATSSRRATRRRLAGAMADCLFEAMRGGSPAVAGRSLLRLDPLRWRGPIGALTFSGGVSEFIYGREANSFDDLGRPGATQSAPASTGFGAPLVEPAEHIRATVIGAAQYTTQVSRQHDLCVAARCTAAAQYPGDRAEFRARRRDRLDAEVASFDPDRRRATRTRGGHGRGVRAVARLRDLRPARRVLPRCGRRSCRRARRMRRSCSRATAMSAASSASICARS